MFKAEDYIKDLVTPKKTSGMYKFGTVDSDYTSGNPKVKLDGETVMSAATYKYLSSYTPTANDRVLLLNANGYVILGKIV